MQPIKTNTCLLTGKLCTGPQALKIVIQCKASYLLADSLCIGKRPTTLRV